MPVLTQFLSTSPTSLGGSGGGATTATVTAADWNNPPPAAGDRLILFFQGFHLWNEDLPFTRDDSNPLSPLGDAGWVDFDPAGPGWTKLTDQWVPSRRPPTSSPTDRRLVVWTRRFVGTPDQEFNFAVSGSYTGAFKSWVLLGYVIRPASVLTDGPNEESWPDPTPAGLTVAVPSMALVAWTGSPSYGAGEGWTSVPSTLSWGVAWKNVSAGAVAMPALDPATRPMAVSFALDSYYTPFFGGIYRDGAVHAS